ncbi:hypothetical protein AAHA92_26008 [Salvia divinorum]|uniref:DUF569 domain-containing protein n=1 Tax=Salvia divinorum TaxID=28513 RepID=A0ABD1GCL3_SALDI
MDIFRKAKSIRMVSYRDKYLTAEEDEESVIQDEQQRQQSVWTVELVADRDAIRLRSCLGTYLTASSIPLLPAGVTAKKAVQTSRESPSDPAIEWEPLRDGMQVKLRSCCGNFLRPNGGLPPWRNIVTHDVPHLPNSGNKLLWDVQIVEKRPPKSKFERCRSGRSFSETMDAIVQSEC